MTEDQIVIQIKSALEALFESVKELYTKDFALLENDVHEQSISYKIAHYFENILTSNDNPNNKLSENNLSVDVEYNRQESLSKKLCHLPNNSSKENLQEINNEIKTIVKKYLKDSYGCYVTEVILENYIDKKTMRPDIILHKRKIDEYNILVIEVKKANLNTNLDKLKLNILTNYYDYKIGLSLVLKTEDKNKPTFTFYVQKKYIEHVEKKLKELKKQMPDYTIYLINTSSIDVEKEIKLS